MRLTKGMQVFSVMLLLGTTLAIDLALPVSAKPNQGTLIARSRRRLKFRTGVRPARSRIGGFSRSATCGTQQMVAVVPPKQSHENIGSKNEAVDKTALERPAFFVYVPSLPPTTGQFTLQNEAGTKDLYNFKFQLTGKSGIVGITLPSSGPALQVGEKYTWNVRVDCEEGDDLIVSNWVERVSAPASTGDDRLASLAEQGIWQDVITSLALQRYQKPGDPSVSSDWVALMEDGGMPEYAKAEIVQIVKK